MHKDDEENTSFITEDGTYYYRAMAFELKNVVATYQMLMNKVFKDQIDRNVEVYINDMIIKSKSFEEHVKYLEEIFVGLDQYQMKLNPTKCDFFIRR